jgi:hypothetical protein
LLNYYSLGIAALNLYSTKGESSEVEGVMMKLSLQKNENDESLLIPATTKKGRAKLAADWISALSKGESFDPSEIDLEKLPGTKRSGDDIDETTSKKPRVPGRPPADEESMRQDPKKYIGVRVARIFPGDGLFFGTVNNFFPPIEGEEDGLWHVLYDDGDEEDYEISELVEYMDLWDDNIDEDKEYAFGSGDK